MVTFAGDIYECLLHQHTYEQMANRICSIRYVCILTI